MSEEHDYREQYNQAVSRAVAGDVGVYPDFDRHRQETVWRLLSSDRQSLLQVLPAPGHLGGPDGDDEDAQEPEAPLPADRGRPRRGHRGQWVRRG